MPQIVIWSWELGPDLSPAKARAAYREVLKGDPCSYCGEFTERSVIDHIVPSSGQGRNEWENLTAACSSCNHAKGYAPLVDFLVGEPVNRHYIRQLRRNGRLYIRPTVEEMALWRNAA